MSLVTTCRGLLVLVCALFFLLLAAPVGGLQEPVPEVPEYVIVKYYSPAGATAASAESTPSLEEQGYRQLPVPEGMTADEYIAELLASPDVALAEKDAPVAAALVPNDPYYGPEQANYLSSIGAPAAWDLESGGEDVIVAIIDSGIDLTHPEFAGRFWVNSSEIPNNGLDDDLNGCTDDRNGCRFVNLTATNSLGCGYTSSQRTGNIADDHGTPGAGGHHSHGTLVGGIAVARGNNNAGVAGMAWGVRIMPIKVLDCGPGFPFGQGQPGGTMFNVAEGVNYAVRHGAKVINLSLNSQSPDSDIAAMRDALLGAKAAGVVVVVSAGNDGATGNPAVGYPAAYAAQAQFSNVVAVAATDPGAGNGRASFSSYGPAVTIAAPGVNIAGPTRVAMGGNTYGEDSGTSFSAPLVTGTLALMKSRKPSLSAEEMVAFLKAGATPVSSPNNPPNWAGAGLLNAGNAVARLPFHLEGGALHDWKDVPAGSTVQALVSGIVCGQATVTSNGLVSTFTMEVAPDAVTPGCGAPGRDVSMVITAAGLGASTAQPAVPWPPKNEWLSKTQDFSTVTPPWGTIVNQQLGQGWSNIAHLASSGALPGAVSNLPANWTVFYHWDPTHVIDGNVSGGYDRFVRQAPPFASTTTSVAQFETYWVDAAGTSLTSINPCQAGCPRIVDFEAGWNNFVYTGPTAHVSTALAPLAGNYQVVMRHDNATGTWTGHVPGLPRYINDFEALVQMSVYWVYLEEPATIQFP